MTASEQVLELKIKEIRHDDALNARPVDTKDESLRELAASIKEQGIWEPVTVTKEKDAKDYRLVFGFRRVAAARLAGLGTVPAIVRSLTEAEILQAQLVENLQREDLTPVQEARALQKVLSADDPPTQQDLAKRLGKSQPWLSNRIRLLGLPEAAVKAIESETLSGKHGEILLQLPKEATPSEVKSLLDQQKYNDLNAREFRAHVQQAAARINRRTKAKKARAHAKQTAKFPDCPKKGCGKPGSPSVEYDGTVKDFRCSSGHYWSPKTGKLTHKYLDSYAAANESREPRAPPPPTLPEVDPTVSGAPPAELVARRLLELIGEVQTISTEPVGHGEVQLVLDAKVGDLAKVRFPPFRLERHYGDSGPTVHIEGLYNQSTDKLRQEAAASKQALIDWLGTIRGVGRPKVEKASPGAAPGRKPGTKKSKKPTAPPASEQPPPGSEPPAPPAELASPPETPANGP